MNPESVIESIKDEKVKGFIKKELQRQQDGLEMIASENYTSLSVMLAQGSILTNKYAEGYPGSRYYGGCQFVDEIEALAIKRAKKIFECDFANVQPHSGSQANMAVYLAELKAGDRILGMNLNEGGHLTHGSPVNFSGRLFEACHYGLDPKTELIDYNEVEKIAKQKKPQMIIAGFSAYPRSLDFKAFREIADKVGAILISDISHIAGLVASKLHPSPIPHSHYTTTTTHKTLRGPRGGMILCNEEKKARKVNSQIFPGIQGGPLEHVIGAKAVAFKEILEEDFHKYSKQVLKNAKKLAETLEKSGFRLVTGGTDNHLLLINLEDQDITGKKAEEVLDRVGITVNKNTIPGEKRSPFVTSGIRLGTPALTTRGMKESQMEKIGHFISESLKNHESKEKLDRIHNEVKEICKDFPLYI